MTSVDALAVGLNFGLLDVPIWYPAPIIGIVTASLVTLGMLLSRLIGQGARKSLQVAGGLILVAIGLKILIEHLTG